MNNQMIVAVPSKGRAGATTTQRFYPGAIWYVPESEAKQYIDIGLDVVAVPNIIRGITKTRNWILENTDARYVVMVDDDAKNVGWTELLPHNRKQRKLNGEELKRNFVRLFEVVEGLKWKIWGTKTEAALRSTYSYQPFMFRSYVTASCMGIINDGSYRFDETYEVKEDYEIGLRHVKDFGGVLCGRYFYWENKHWSDDGGCKTYRTQDIEKKCIRQLMKQYPGMIRSVKRSGCEYSIQLEF